MKNVLYLFVVLIASLFLSCASSQNIDGDLDIDYKKYQKKKSSKKKKKSAKKEIYDWDKEVSGPGSRIN